MWNLFYFVHKLQFNILFLKFCKNSARYYHKLTDFFTSFLTYLLTPSCRVIFEKLTGLQLVKNFPSFHETRRIINAVTSVRHLSLSWSSRIQPIYPHPTNWISVLILSTHLSLVLPSGLFPLFFHTKTLYTPSPHTYVPRAHPITNLLMSLNSTNFA